MRRLLLLALIILPLLPFTGLGQEPPPKTIVIGTGNRLSGRLRIAGTHDLEGLELFAMRVRERCGLDLQVDSIPVSGLREYETGGQGIVVRGDPYQHRDGREAFWLDPLRRTIRESPHVRHLPTVFRWIRDEFEDEWLTIRTETLLPGRLSLALLTFTGEVLRPEGPVLPLDLSKIANREDVLVRLRWRGEDDLTDEARLWLPDLIPGELPTVRIRGADSVPVGVPWLGRVQVTQGRDPLPGIGVTARFGDRKLAMATDAAGSAVLSLPPFESAADDPAFLHVTVRGPRFVREFRALIGVTPRKLAAHLETDRPLYRPGGTVKLRAILTDSVNRVASPGIEVDLVVTDPRKRMIATLTATTDAFGIATFELPLAEGILEGKYEATVRSGADPDIAASRTFGVEELILPPFEVAVILDKPAFRPGEQVAGTIRAQALTGEPLKGALVQYHWEGNPELRCVLDARGESRFELDPPRRVASIARLVVTVEHGGTWAGRQVPVRTLPSKETHRAGSRAEILAPDTVPIGGSFDVTVRLPRVEGPVLLDLMADHGLIATATGALEDGVATLRLTVPEGLAGPALLLARSPERREASRAITIADPLQVNLEVSPDEAAPGDPVTLRAHVRDKAGRDVPSVLDVRAYDRAYLSLLAGGPSESAGIFGGSRAPHPLPLLAESTPRDARLDAAVRAERAARPVLKAALDRLRAGKDLADLRMPWGTKLSVREVGDHVHVSSGAAICFLPGGERDLLPGEPVAVGRFSAPPSILTAAHILPRPRILKRPPRNPGIVEGGLGWLPRHQSPDGAFSPVRFREMCQAGGCDGEGDPRLEIGSTGAGVLAYLGAGETHKHGRYRRQVRTGLLHLRRLQQADGFYGDPGSEWALLNHAMAAFATCEAYGLTLSPLFKAPGQQALDALAARQRSDGGFAEDGWEDGSLILTAWASAALKAGRISGLTVSREVVDGIARWADRHADTDTGVIPCSVQEIQDYPFAAPDLSPGPEGMTVLIRIFTERRRAGPWRLRDAAGLPRVPPPTAAADLHGIWWGTAAAYQIGGDSWRAFSAAQREVLETAVDRAGCRSGSFSPGTSHIGRPAATAFGTMCFEVYYRYSRTFGGVRGVGGAFGGPGGAFGPGPGRQPRRDFPDLLLADLALPTDDTGRLALPIDLADSVTTWDFIVGAWDGKGRYGRARAEVKATLPVSLGFEVPPRLAVGDILEIPVRVRSRQRKTCTISVGLACTGSLTVRGRKEVSTSVLGGGVSVLRFTVEATGPGGGTIRAAMTGPHQDVMERTVEVASRKYPFQIHVPVVPGVSGALAPCVPEDAWPPNTQLFVRTGPLDDAEASIRGLVRRPTGCFEQTASTLYPALFAFRYLTRVGATDPEFEARARSILTLGYQRILSYEVEGGGFSMWGRAPDRSDCNALAIHLLLDLKAVMAVDEGVIERAARRLAKKLPETNAPRIYALGALKRAGHEVKLDREIGDDAYATALAAVHGVLPKLERDRAVSLLEGADRTAGGPTLFAGSYRSTVEATALATHALSLLGGSPEKIAAGYDRVLSTRRPDGAWNTTRATVAALRCMEQVASPEPIEGVLTLKRPGKPDVTVEVGGRKWIRVDLGDWHRTGEFRLDFEGTGRPLCKLSFTGESVWPPTGADRVIAAIGWPVDPMVAGVPFEIDIRVGNPTEQALHAPTVEIPLPAGLRLNRSLLDQLIKNSGFARAEVRKGILELYIDRLDPGGVASMAVPFVPVFRGAFRSGPARAYPYYEPWAATHIELAILRVHR